MTRVFPSFISAWPSFLLVQRLTVAQKDSPLRKASSNCFRPSSSMVFKALWAESTSSDVVSKLQHHKPSPSAAAKDVATVSAFHELRSSSIFRELSRQRKACEKGCKASSCLKASNAGLGLRLKSLPVRVRRQSNFQAQPLFTVNV